MISLGRNDPCWCGSGKKYKKCHLAEDEKKERELRATPASWETRRPSSATEFRPSGLDETGDWPDDVSVEGVEQDVEEALSLEEYDQLWERFESASTEEKADLYLDTIESGKMDEELAFEMLLDLKYEVGEDRFQELVDRLRIGSPESYTGIAQDLSLWMIESAAAKGRSEKIPGLLRPFVEPQPRASRDLFELIDVLMYYGETESLLNLMKATASAVYKSEDFAESRPEFAEAGIALVTARYVDANGTVDAAAPGFREDISTFLPGFSDRVDELEATAKPVDQPLTMNDLKQDNRKGTRERIRRKLREIGVRWSNSLLRENPSMYTRAQLARQEMFGLQMELLDKSKEGARLLLPRPKDLDTYLGAMLGPIEPMPHRAAATVELLPSYLRFLVQQGLLSEDQVKDEIGSLRNILEDTILVLEKLTPELAPIVEKAWR